MDGVTGFDERRVHKRYRAQKGAFVAPRAPVRKLWQILDISLGGLAFRYIPSIQKISESADLEIITHDVRFSLENIPYKSVSETGLSGDSLLNYPLRRHSVQFEVLTESQVSKLEYFIQNHTGATE